MQKIYLDIKYGENETAKGYVLDISNSGMGIASSVKIKENSTIDIITDQPVRLSLKARVLFVASYENKDYSYRLGVELTSFDEKTRKNLTDFILKKERRKSGRLIMLKLWKQD